MTNTTQHTPDGFFRTFNILNEYRNDAPRDKDRISQALKDNKEVYEQRAELLKALEALRDRALRDAEAQGLNDNAPIYAFIQGATDAIAKARGQA